MVEFTPDLLKSTVDKMVEPMHDSRKERVTNYWSALRRQREGYSIEEDRVGLGRLILERGLDMDLCLGGRVEVDYIVTIPTLKDIFGIEVHNRQETDEFLGALAEFVLKQEF